MHDNAVHFNAQFDARKARSEEGVDDHASPQQRGRPHRVVVVGRAIGAWLRRASCVRSGPFTPAP